MEKIKELKTYITSEPFLVIDNDNMRQTVEYYAAFAFPILFIRKVTTHWDDGSISELNIHLHDLIKEERTNLLREFVKALPRLFIEIAQGTAREEEYDAVMVSLALMVGELGIDNIKIEHVLKLLQQF